MQTVVINYAVKYSVLKTHLGYTSKDRCLNEIEWLQLCRKSCITSGGDFKMTVRKPLRSFITLSCEALHHALAAVLEVANDGLFR